MQKHYNYLNIDLDKKIHTKLKAKQGDSKSRYILVNLISNSTYYDLSDCTVKIYGVKKDKTIFFNHATVTNAKQGQFEIELTTQALAVPGEIEIQILILGTNQEKLTTFSFFIDVNKTIIDDAAIESTNEFTALTEALSSVQNIDNRFAEVDEQFNTIKQQADSVCTLIDSQSAFDKVKENMINGGTYKFTTTVNSNSDVVINNSCYLYSNNNTGINFLAGRLILNEVSVVDGLYLSGYTYDFSNTDGVINIKAKCNIKNCEIDGKTIITTDSVGSGNGGYGIALFLGADGTIIENNYIHNVSNSFIENWHNNVSLGHPHLDNLIIKGNKLVDSETGDGIAINGSNCNISFNSLNGKWENGFLVHPKNESGVNCENVVFEGNTFNVTNYQEIKNGYALAIREGDDKKSSSNNCKVINNIFKGWGNTSNGVEGIRIDETCKNTLVDGNLFEGNIPSRASCVRDRGVDTVISNNTFYMTKGVYAIQKVLGTGIITRNRINTVGVGINPISFDGGIGKTEVSYNIINSDKDIVLNNSNIKFKNNIVKSSGTALSTTTTVTDLVIESNELHSVESCLNFNGINGSIINNIMYSDKDCLLITSTSRGNFVKGNTFIVNTESVNKRDCVINYGGDNIIDGNIFRSSGRNNFQITSTATGKCYFINNILLNTNPITLNNYLDFTYIENNELNNANITLSSTKPVIINDNKNTPSLLTTNGVMCVVNKVLKQNAIPGSGGTNDVANSNFNYIYENRIMVQNTGTTPNDYYLPMSNNTWLKINA